MRSPYRYLVREWYDDGETYETLFLIKRKALRYAEDVLCSGHPCQVQVIDLWEDKPIS